MNQKYKMMCCDCGLVHTLKFDVMKITKRFKDNSYNADKVNGFKVSFRAWRDDRATALTRRQRKRQLLKGDPIKRQKSKRGRVNK